MPPLILITALLSVLLSFQKCPLVELHLANNAIDGEGGEQLGAALVSNKLLEVLRDPAVYAWADLTSSIGHTRRYLC